MMCLLVGMMKLSFCKVWPVVGFPLPLPLAGGLPFLAFSFHLSFALCLSFTFDLGLWTLLALLLHHAH